MAEDAGGHDVFAEALSGGGEGQISGTMDAGSSSGGAAQEMERNDLGRQGGSEPSGQSQAEPAPFDINTLPEDIRAKLQGFDERQSWVPPHRLREAAEERRQLESRLYQMEADARRRSSEDQQRQAEQQHQTAEFDWNNPFQSIDGRMQHLLQQALGPMQQRFDAMSQGMLQETQRRSLSFAQQQHGADKVQAAYGRAMQAVQAGDPGAIALNQRINQSYDPWGDVMDWDRRRDLYEQTGGNLETYNQRQQEALLKDPAFLSRAMEAHRQQATPVQIGTGAAGRPQQQSNRGMPSLNRATSAQDDGAELEDPQAVFQQALDAPRPRPR